jgi:hypothetical protein
MNLAPLLAAGGVGVLIGLAVLILTVVIPLIGQFFAKVKSVQQQMNPQRQPREGGIQDEIDEFLRQAAEGRARVGPPSRPARPAASRPPARPPEAPVTAQVLDENDTDAVGDEVEKHVRKYLDTGEFSRRGKQLGEEVAQADEDFEQKAKQKFGHEVGHLAKKRGEAAKPPEPAEAVVVEDFSGATPVTTAVTSDLTAWFSRPELITQAIMMSEILQRPEDRWA